MIPPSCFLGVFTTCFDVKSIIWWSFLKEIKIFKLTLYKTTVFQPINKNIFQNIKTQEQSYFNMFPLGTDKYFNPVINDSDF